MRTRQQRLQVAPDRADNTGMSTSPTPLRPPRRPPRLGQALTAVLALVGVVGFVVLLGVGAGRAPAAGEVDRPPGVEAVEQGTDPQPHGVPLAGSGSGGAAPVSAGGEAEDGTTAQEDADRAAAEQRAAEERAAEEQAEADRIAAQAAADEAAAQLDATARAAARQAAADQAAAQAAAEAVAREEAERLDAQDAAVDPRYPSCTEATAHGYGHYVSGVDAEYGWYRDTDADGVVCEV
jgi:type IV secretory pathway VirB10-like protein